MITEALLILPLYLIWFFIWWLFQHLIKIMADVENILNDDEFFGEIVDTPKEGIVQHKKRECLKSVIDSGKAYLLGPKWTQERVDKGSDETNNQTYAEYKQRELNEKGGKTGRAIGKHVINLYPTGVSRAVKIRGVKKLRWDIENDPIIKYQMVNLGYLSVCTFGNFLVPVLVAAHTVNNLGPGNELENEGYESEIYSSIHNKIFPLILCSSSGSAEGQDTRNAFLVS